MVQHADIDHTGITGAVAAWCAGRITATGREGDPEVRRPSAARYRSGAYQELTPIPSWSRCPLLLSALGAGMRAAAHCHRSRCLRSDQCSVALGVMATAPRPCTTQPHTLPVTARCRQAASHIGSVAMPTPSGAAVYWHGSGGHVTGQADRSSAFTLEIHVRA